MSEGFRYYLFKTMFRNIINKFKSLSKGLNVPSSSSLSFSSKIKGENISIGKNCFIGAGAVVTKDVLNNQVVYGVPARLMKMHTLSADLDIFDNL